MKRSILYFVFAVSLMLVAGCSYFDKEESAPVGKIPRDLPVWSEVEITDLRSSDLAITFEKSGMVAPEVVSYVSPQVVGNVVELNAVVGKKVKKGELLAVLGDSIATEMADVQKGVAGDVLDFTGEIVQSNDELLTAQLRGASIGVKSAWDSYQAALKAKKEARDLFELQVDSAELNVERADEAYDDARDAYEDLEDQLDEMDDDAEGRAELEAQLEQLEKAMDAAEDAVTMSESGVSQIEEGYDVQVNQLNLGVEMALNQYQAAINQYNSAGIGADVQSLSSDLQLLQAQSAYTSAQISADAKNIVAPISGVISQVLAEMNNLVAPGQVVFKIENPDKLSVKTAVSLDEVKFLQVGDEVMVVAGDKLAKGRVASISPVLNEMTRKIDVEIEILDEGVFVSGQLVKIQYRLHKGIEIFVPLVSLDVEGEDQFVKVVDMNGKVVFKVVKIGQVFGNYVEILSGLRGNELVISSPSSFISEGERVNIKPVKIER